MTKLLTTALKYHGTNPKGWKYPWCAAFLNLVLDELRVPHNKSLLARSFLDLGKPINVARVGDIVVFWRKEKKSIWGHSGLYINEDKTHIAILGGNQDKSVCIKKYPKSRLLGIRRICV
jgi:uncharacterized protein (TIGR02594 family)